MLSLGVLLSWALGQESPENSEYSRWAVFEKGAIAEYRQVGEVAGGRISSRSTASGDRPARTVLELTRWAGSRRDVD